ncbi:hypothetical protein ACTSKR_13390 [Chitinibacteraceae bacterium HSL-7]
MKTLKTWLLLTLWLGYSLGALAWLSRFDTSWCGTGAIVEGRP